ncbi:AraC-type DNA-binding protein [Pseudobutyrivibrio sp. YE44]|uniref:helix-turn-helix transcriptional regulator n=1 Tax=Pseudobutyrivibrio sp. YE44 TaxID=1520802 RepID=UPI0008922D39|nr:AraC family transcriptional regulator [Pseudobutyrivibrio sp. YE44]SDB34268.1 AraC-type DNA-binding protein [Pseudobutyrivibrio sp. YE44]
MNKLLSLAINKLGHDWSHLNWDFRDFKLVDGTPDKMSQWQGDPQDDIMVVVFKGRHISEPFHRQDFFFIDYAYHLDYNALSAKFDNLVTIREGDCYIGQPFSGYALKGNSTDDDIIMIGVHIKKEAFFREYLPALSQDPDMFRFFLDPQTDKFSDEFIHLSFEKTSPVRALLEMMVIEYADRKEDTQLILKPMVLALFMHIARRYRLEKADVKASTLSECIVGYINSHPESVTLKDISAHFSYHPNYISSLLHKELGKTFSEIVLEKRMDRAVVLLRGTTLSIEEISAMLGYTNTSNFYKAFRSYYGKTPREYIG